MKKLLGLLRFLTRRPVANIFRAELLTESQSLHLAQAELPKTESESPPDFTQIVHVLRSHTDHLHSVEKRLRRIEEAAFKTEISRSFAPKGKIAYLRHSLVDELNFLSRATALGFSPDNLQLALESTQKALGHYQTELTTQKNALESRLLALSIHKNAKLLLWG